MWRGVVCVSAAPNSWRIEDVLVVAPPPPSPSLLCLRPSRLLFFWGGGGGNPQRCTLMHPVVVQPSWHSPRTDLPLTAFHVPCILRLGRIGARGQRRSLEIAEILQTSGDFELHMQPAPPPPPARTPGSSSPTDTLSDSPFPCADRNVALGVGSGGANSAPAPPCTVTKTLRHTDH